MKPVIDALKSNRAYGVDTDAFNPDGVIAVETNEELARIPSDRRTPNLRVKVNSTNKYYKVDPENIEQFIETTLEEVNAALVVSYSKAEIDAKLADVNEKIEEVKSSGNSLTKEVADAEYASKAELNELSGRLDNVVNDNALTREVADSVYASKAELSELSGRLDNTGSTNTSENVNLADSAEYIALNNKVTTLEGEVGNLRSALDAKADLASVPSLTELEGEVAKLKAALDSKADIDSLPDVQEYANTILTALSTGPGLDILTKNILASIEKANSDKTPSGGKPSTEESNRPVEGSGEPSGGTEEIPSTSTEQTPPVSPEETPKEPTDSSDSSSTGTSPDAPGTSAGDTSATASKIAYWGVVPNDAPTAENIVALADKKEVETLTDLEISFGNEEDEGYVVFAAPASLAGSVTFINRNNTFTQVPLKEGTVEISGTEYKYFIFEYSFEQIPFKLR